MDALIGLAKVVGPVQPAGGGGRPGSGQLP